MSVRYLHVIPAAPEHVPTEEARERALAAFRDMVPLAWEVTATVHEHLVFLDAGEGFAAVRCPSCGADLGDVWVDWMDASHESRFVERTHLTPCCHREVRLEDLAYDGPQGFARFVLQAYEAGIDGFLTPAQVARLEDALGCPLRQVLSHY